MQNKKNLILIVDDEPQIRKILRIALNSENFKTEEAASGKEASKLATIVKPDLVILDLGLPDMDGKDVVELIRSWSQVPIIICSVRSDDEEIIDALNCGADDYLTKPFNTEVLLAKINANLRKNAVKKSGEPILKNGKISMDLVRHEVFINKKNADFTPKEYDLLKYFMNNKGKMLTHKQILSDVWGMAHADYVQYLRVYIKQVREKIEKDAKDPKIIVTESGIGYRMEDLDA